MTDEREVTPTLDDGLDELFVDAAEATPAALVAAPMIKCATCGNDFARKGMNSKFCETCQPARKAITRTKRADKKKATSFIYDSGTEPTKTEGKELLAARGITNAHILDLCYELALVAAAQNDVQAAL